MTSATPAFLELRDTALACTACRLSETRTNVVFGVGDPSARLMLVGEAPGKNEDLQGEPFVGAAGGLLDELLATIGISRAEAYIANVLKCRPPGNRDPREDEIDSCKGYLRSQIRMIRPEVVITLGNFATKLLLATETGITRLRGQRFDWWLGATLIPTFHPAAALRGRPQVREQMQQDFALARAVLDESPRAGPAGTGTANPGFVASLSDAGNPGLREGGPDGPAEPEQTTLRLST
ncbi:MAG TPA: uracil-DNA glycosylase [Acidimicrobiia bacterium]|nr:uracil-DNA glycosylase [Acidimicrobiia bacterium]